CRRRRRAGSAWCWAAGLGPPRLLHRPRNAAAEGPAGPLHGPLEQRRLSLPDPDAERRKPVAPAATPQLVQQRDDEARPAHPEWMAEGDRAAVDVHLFLVETELAHHDEAL